MQCRQEDWDEHGDERLALRLDPAGEQLQDLQLQREALAMSRVLFGVALLRRIPVR